MEARVSDDVQEVRWTPSSEGLLVRGASGDSALLYRVLRADDEEEWVVEGTVAGRSHSGTFGDRNLAHDVLGLLADRMQRELGGAE